MTEARENELAEKLEARAAIDEAAAAKKRQGVRWHEMNAAKIHERHAELDRLAASTLRANAERIKALEALALRAEEELRLIRMKDSDAVYDVTLRSDMNGLLFDARAVRSNANG